MSFPVVSRVPSLRVERGPYILGFDYHALYYVVPVRLSTLYRGGYFRSVGSFHSEYILRPFGVSINTGVMLCR